jgi:hypothetical protein
MLIKVVLQRWGGGEGRRRKKEGRRRRRRERRKEDEKEGEGGVRQKSCKSCLGEATGKQVISHITARGQLFPSPTEDKLVMSS